MPTKPRPKLFELTHSTNPIWQHNSAVAEVSHFYGRGATSLSEGRRNAKILKWAKLILAETELNAAKLKAAIIEAEQALEPWKY